MSLAPRAIATGVSSGLGSQFSLMMRITEL